MKPVLGQMTNNNKKSFYLVTACYLDQSYLLRSPCIGSTVKRLFQGHNTITTEVVEARAYHLQSPLNNASIHKTSLSTKNIDYFNLKSYLEAVG